MGNLSINDDEMEFDVKDYMQSHDYASFISSSNIGKIEYANSGIRLRHHRLCHKREKNIKLIIRSNSK